VETKSFKTRQTAETFRHIKFTYLRKSSVGVTKMNCVT